MHHIGGHMLHILSASQYEPHKKLIPGGGMNWIKLAYDRDQWRALVNTITKFWVP
jgi:hypothetical protein